MTECDYDEYCKIHTSHGTIASLQRGSALTLLHESLPYSSRSQMSS